MTSVHIGQGGAPDDLMMLVGEMDGKLVCALQYNTDLFDRLDDRADGRALR